MRHQSASNATLGRKITCIVLQYLPLRSPVASHHGGHQTMLLSIRNKWSSSSPYLSSWLIKSDQYTKRQNWKKKIGRLEMWLDVLEINHSQIFSLAVRNTPDSGNCLMSPHKLEQWKFSANSNFLNLLHDRNIRWLVKKGKAQTIHEKLSAALLIPEIPGTAAPSQRLWVSSAGKPENLVLVIDHLTMVEMRCESLPYMAKGSRYSFLWRNWWQVLSLSGDVFSFLWIKNSI